jgi:hypothetical protein
MPLSRARPRTWSSRPLLLACLVAAASLCFATPGLAQHRGGGGDRPERGDRHFDGRFDHDHYYPPRGYVVPRPPRDSIVVQHYDRRYWYGGGAWYAPRGPRFVVVGPPFGAFVSVLPPFYTTVWFGGLPYYYANDSYYLWREQRRAYEVVEPPPQAQATTEPPAVEDVYVYPKNGQSAEQQAQDRYECHRWAADQTGFDPTRPSGGVAVEQARAKREEYFRAMTACLEGRGYSAK